MCWTFFEDSKNLSIIQDRVVIDKKQLAVERIGKYAVFSRFTENPND